MVEILIFIHIQTTLISRIGNYNVIFERKVIHDAMNASWSESNTKFHAMEIPVWEFL